MIRLAVLINNGKNSVVLFRQIVLTHIAPGFKILYAQDLLDERTSDVQLYLPDEHEKTTVVKPPRLLYYLQGNYSAALAALAAPS